MYDPYFQLIITSLTMLNDDSTDKKANVQIFLRIRPPNSEYTFIDAISEHKRNISIVKDFEIRSFNFNKIFTPDITQFKVCFESCVNVLKAVLNGYNGCIIAYGQTGSGKTFTVLGEGNSIQGVLQYSLTTLLSTKKDLYIELSGMEIYMDKIFDIINTKNNQNISFTYTTSKGANIRNLSKYRIGTVAELEVLIKEIIKNRRTQTTKMNIKSSRSHAIFSVNVFNPEFKEPSVLNIVDLAGSERVKKSQTIDPRSMDETISINTSLSALSKCIFSLTKSEVCNLNSSINSSMRSSNNRSSKSLDRSSSRSRKPQQISSSLHVPYRDSKLTMVLQNALSGKSHLSLIITLSPDDVDVEESFSALRFANCAMKLEIAPEKAEKQQRKKSPEFIANINHENDKDEIVIERYDNGYQTSQFTDSDNNYVTNFTFDDNKGRINRKQSNNTGKNRQKQTHKPKQVDIQLDKDIFPKPTMHDKLKSSQSDLVNDLRREIEQLKLVNEGFVQENDDLKFEIAEYKYKHDSIQFSKSIQEKDFIFVSKQIHNYLIYDNQNVDSIIKQQLNLTKQKIDYFKYNAKLKAEMTERILTSKTNQDYAKCVREYIAGKRILKFLRKRIKSKTNDNDVSHYQKLKIGMGKKMLSQLMKRVSTQMKGISRLINNKSIN